MPRTRRRQAARPPNSLPQFWPKFSYSRILILFLSFSRHGVCCRSPSADRDCNNDHCTGDECQNPVGTEAGEDKSDEISCHDDRDPWLRGPRHPVLLDLAGRDMGSVMLPKNGSRWRRRRALWPSTHLDARCPSVMISYSLVNCSAATLKSLPVESSPARSLPRSSRYQSSANSLTSAKLSCLVLCRHSFPSR